MIRGTPLTPPPLRKFITSNLHCKITKNRSKPLPRKICTCEYKLKALNSCTWTCIYILLKLFHRYQIINLKTARAIRLLLYFTRYTLNINNNNAQRSTYIWYVNVNMQCTFFIFYKTDWWLHIIILHIILLSVSRGHIRFECNDHVKIQFVLISCEIFSLKFYP